MARGCTATTARRATTPAPIARRAARGCGRCRPIASSLSAATGCVHWYFEADRAVRTAVMIGRVRDAAGQRDTAFFGDQGGTAYALNAADGKLLWKTKVEDFAGSRITGSPVFHNG